MLSHPYASFLKDVEKPGRYVGGEFGSVVPKTDADLRLALSYPDVYEIGMSHIGLGVLYEVANGLEGVSCERVFMPWPDLEKKLIEHDVPLVSLEGARPLVDFDMVGFSLQYELTYTNIIAMLDLGGIPRRAADRGDNHPIVIVGGPLSAHCEPISPFVDIVVLGDGEESLPQLIARAREAKQAGLDRNSTVEAMATFAFAFAPNTLERHRDKRSNREVVTNDTPVAAWARVTELGSFPPGGTLVPNVEAVFDRFSVEVARGCASGCRFCQAGFLYRPVRERSKEEVERAVERAVACSGFDGVSVASLSTADHSQVGPMLTGLGERYTPRRVSFFVPSLRAYGLEPEVVEVLSRLRATGVTLAPEAGSERLRQVVNKNVTEDDLLTAAARFFDWGMSRVKLYFMLGLPTETDDDLEAIVTLGKRVRDLGRRRLHGRNPSVIISVSTFVPKPFTPFERETMIDGPEIDRRQKLLVALGKRERLEVKTHSPPLSVLEGILCRGDRSLAKVLEAAVDLGARFDGWSEMYKRKTWDTVLKDLDTSSLLAAMPEGGRLPWDHVSVGVTSDFLRTEREAAMDAVPTAPCGRFAVSADENRFVCHHCGLECKRATVPLKTERLGSRVEDLPAPAPRPKGKPRPRAAQDTDDIPSTRVLLNLAKWGRQTYVGHLDTMRHVMRTFRRAGLELYYTKGFNPKPKLVSGPPLPVGMAALRDPLEVRLIDPPSASDILARLREASPPDLTFVDAQISPDDQKALSRRIQSADYLAFVPMDRVTATKGVSGLLSKKTIEVTRERKGKTKTLDIRPYIIGADITDAPGEDLPFALPSDRVIMAFSLYIPGSGGARPSEVLRAAFGDIADRAWVVRTRIHLEP